ncbi:MAG: amidophosphoribosyltransferase [Acidobacteria bacterium]|nr:amidophosphoribosyltransferase [Acidobacteriota bacterium]
MGTESPREECGLFGVWAPGEEIARLTFFGLYALQHRGQESAGIAVADGTGILVDKDMGLVAQIFTERRLAPLQGHLGIGHVRYSTTGSSRWENAQPSFKPAARGSGVALGHNGNLTNTRELAARVKHRGPGPRATTDSDIVASLLAEHPADDLEDAIAETMPQLRGAYSFLAMDERTVYGARDPYGVRPLVVGRLAGGGWILASETCALDIVGASYVRDVEPGELVTIDERGLRSRIFAKPDPKLCLFEFVYLARPDSVLYGRNVHEVRRELGRLLAQESPAEADLVIGVPDTGPAAAGGFAEISGIPYGEGIVKNRYVGRTFIQPTQTIRQLGIRLKLNPLHEAIRDRRLVVVDDSIVRGNTTRQLVRMLRESGAREVHLRITCPPIRWPCFYGIDMATRAELVASDLAVEEIRQYVGADSLAYLSLASLVKATGSPPDHFCRACFDGIYPISIPEDTEAPKLVLEER